MSCPRCSGTDLIYDPVQGNTSCFSCGCVVEETQIVSEPTFHENAAGGVSMTGQYIGPSGHGFMVTPHGMHHMASESRELTIARARQKLQQLGSLLRLSEHHVEAATRLYTLALQNKFSRGRKLPAVLAACLYVICRQEKTPHMLIDFSDVMKTNVFVLGHTFLQLVKQLNLSSTLPDLDPCLYIHRFASQMKLGDKAQTVALTALRLVGRMKRDWIQQGRRPAGICGACLVISARLHGFNHNVDEVVGVVRVGETTIRKRLREFTESPASNLTLNQFMQLKESDDIGACDPPSFKDPNKIKAMRVKRGRPRIIDSDDDSETETQASGGGPSQLEYVAEVVALPSADELERELHDLCKDEQLRSMIADGDAVTNDVQNNTTTPPTSPQKQQSNKNTQSKQSSTNTDTNANTNTAPSSPHDTDTNHQQQQDIASPPCQKPTQDDEQTSPQTSQANTPNTQEHTVIEDDDSLLLSADEARIKLALWMEMNKEWLEDQKKRELNKDTQPNKTRRKRKRGQGLGTADSAADAVRNALDQRVSSSKINYDVVRGLFSINPADVGARRRTPLGLATDFSEIPETQETANGDTNSVVSNSQTLTVRQTIGDKDDRIGKAGDTAETLFAGIDDDDDLEDDDDERHLRVQTSMYNQQHDDDEARFLSDED